MEFLSILFNPSECRVIPVQTTYRNKGWCEGSVTSDCDVIMPPSKDTPDVKMLWHLPDVQGILFHTTARGVVFVTERERERKDTYISHKVHLPLQTAHCALAWTHLNCVMFLSVGWTWKYLKACFLARVTLRHSPVHHGTGAWWGLVDDLWTEVLSAQRMMFVKCSSIVPVRNSWMSNYTELVKLFQPPSFIIQFIW